MIFGIYGSLKYCTNMPHFVQFDWRISFLTLSLVHTNVFNKRVLATCENLVLSSIKEIRFMQHLQMGIKIDLSIKCPNGHTFAADITTAK